MREASKDNPCLFIVGCPRSGTTLLERMVNSHPEIAIVHETHWIANFIKKHIGVTADGFVTPEMIAALSEHHRFRYLQMSREDVANLIAGSGPLSYADFVSAIFDLYGKRQGKRLVGDKTTGNYLRNLPLLHSLWPKARFLHLIRDGRNVCLSMLNWPKADRAAGRLATWAENPVASTALWWAWQVRRGLKAGDKLDRARLYEMRYESLVQDPGEECAKVCALLGVDYNEAMVRFNDGKTLSEPGLSANKAWLPATKGLRDWRTQLAEPDVELFEAIAGDLLSELGYERAFKTISPEVAKRAEGFQAWWATRHSSKADSNRNPKDP